MDAGVQFGTRSEDDQGRVLVHAQKSCHSLPKQYKYGAYPGPWEKYRHQAADAAVSTADSVTYYTDRVSPFSPETLAIKRRGKTAQIRVEKQADHEGIHEGPLSLIIRYRNSALRQASSPPITVNSTVVFNISANGSVRMSSKAGRVKWNCDRLVAPSVSDPSWSGLHAENRTRKHNSTRLRLYSMLRIEAQCTRSLSRGSKSKLAPEFRLNRRTVIGSVETVTKPAKPVKAVELS